MECARRDHDIECLVQKGEALGPTRLELCGGSELGLCDVQHRRRGVNAGQFRTGERARERLEKRARATTHIEQRVAGMRTKAPQRLAGCRIDVE